MKLGICLVPQHTTVDVLRKAWKEVDEGGFDTLWTEDHFFPITGDPNGNHFECWSMLGAMAVETAHAQFGALVTSNSYRNADLLADMARTIDVLSGGRFILGIGAGWFQRDYEEYGFEFGTATERARRLELSLPRIRSRLSKLNPGPVGLLPILIGGGGEKSMLPIVAKYAQIWNFFARESVAQFSQKNMALDEWCARFKRNPREIERSVALSVKKIDEAEAYIKAGATHLIISIPHPFDLEPAQTLLRRLRRACSKD